MHFYVDGITTPRKRRNSVAKPHLSLTLDITTITHGVPLQPACIHQADTLCPCHIFPPKS